MAFAPVQSFGMRLFLPTPRETNLLILLGFAVFGYALYLRFMVVDAPSLELACPEGLDRAVCGLRKTVIELRDLQFFGGLALVCAVLQLIRPRFATLALGMTAALFGLILHNTGVSALAAALLVMGFARSAHADRSRPRPEARGRTRAPASSRMFR